MTWYDEAVFYHIYPLGMCGAPKHNQYSSPEPRILKLIPWITHISNIGCNTLYIGPLFESVGHGYETTDYKKLDSRLGTNDDLVKFIQQCHEQGIRVVLDGVFNHTGRDFFAFKDLQSMREHSRFKDWFCNVNFSGDNEYQDGFSYDNWGGYNLLVKLNQRNPEVTSYICNVVRYWVETFDIDGIRLDAADVLDFDFMKMLRSLANEIKPDFWLMGEVIHGDYSRWVNEETLHSVTNYQLHKALYSGHNDHNYFEIAHTVNRLYDMGGNRPDGLKLYNFVDNHDVERIYTKLSNKKHSFPVHVLLYTLPGIPSIYYGSEFGIEGKKESFSDASLRPELRYDDFKDVFTSNSYNRLITVLGKIRQATPVLSYGDYKQLILTNEQYVFSRNSANHTAIVAVNNGDHEATVTINSVENGVYTDLLSGKTMTVKNGSMTITIKDCSGQIWVNADEKQKETYEKQIELYEKEPESYEKQKDLDENQIKSDVKPESGKSQKELHENPLESERMLGHSYIVSQEGLATKSYDEMSIEELQAAILLKMSKNGPVTDQMKRDVYQNVYHDALINWVKSFQ